jgi:hypothetical protein
VGRSTVLCPKVGRAGTGTVSRRGGTETRRGVGVDTPAGPAFRSPPPVASGPECGGRVATTARWRLPSGGRIPRLVVGTKLAGVVAIWGAVCVGWRFFRSTCATRADVMEPRPKCCSLIVTTEFCTLVLR